jgi:hypothetical protein
VRIVDYSIRNVQIDLLSDVLAEATFDKSWDARTLDNRRFAGDERQRLKFRLIDGKWRIISEEELKIYWVSLP